MTHTNPTVLVLQATLMSPNYQGPGRWVVFVPEERKNYLAIGKDSVPNLIKILALFSDVNSNIDFKHSTIPISEDDKTMLLQNRLVLSDASLNHESLSFLKLYQMAVFNYPFNDYFHEKWAVFDYKQMEQYKKISSRPEPIKDYEGIRYSLPSVSELHSEKSLIQILAETLQLTFSEIDRIYRDDGTYWVRKTSPSGGARHPTEGYISLPNPCEGIPEGFYAYDAIQHNLVHMDKDNHWIKNKSPDYLFSIIIKSHLERAMWRYREIRAFRPALIDAGHIIETVSQILTLQGFSIDITLGNIKSQDELSWIEDPVIATLHVYKSSVRNEINTPLHHKATVIHDDMELQTNPGLYFTFNKGLIIANALWPSITETPITMDEFLLINHCLFSRRNDRATDRVTIKETYSIISEPRLNELIQLGILMNKNTAIKMYEKILLWSKYDWYLSWLAYLAMSQEKNWINQYRSLPDNTSIMDIDHLKNILLQRKTIRNFSEKNMTQKDLLDLLRTTSVFDADDIHKIYVAVFQVEDMDSGMYIYDHKKEELTKISLSITPEKIREMTIGQAPAGRGAVTIWVVTACTKAIHDDYLKSIILLGMIGQKFCLLATAKGLGVFLTPALCDEMTCRILNIDEPLYKILYTFTLGYPK